jgi:hypothetical protein
MDKNSEHYIRSETGGYYTNKKGKITSYEILNAKANREKSVKETLDWIMYW